MADLILLAQVATTLFMAGLIWFVQVVHYPLFVHVGRQRFPRYETSHQVRTTVLVVPMMLAEAATALALLFWRPTGVPLTAAVTGFVLLALIWGCTHLWQVPIHTRLSKAFDVAAYRRLLKSNWVRTILWTLRGLLVLWMVCVAWA